MKCILTCLALCYCLLSVAQSKSSLLPWYDKPSGTVWENALPLGNGRIGAMVYGNVDTERIQLNEHTLWSGGPNRNDNPLNSHQDQNKIVNGETV